MLSTVNPFVLLSREFMHWIHELYIMDEDEKGDAVKMAVAKLDHVINETRCRNCESGNRKSGSSHLLFCSNHGVNIGENEHCSRFQRRALRFP